MWPGSPQGSPLDALIAGSAGSRLIGYHFESKSLTVQLFHDAIGHLLLFAIPTDTVHGRSASSDPARSTCRIELISLESALLVRDGRYVPPTETDQFRDHARGRLTLAYGRRASEFRWLFRLSGAYPLLACLIRDPGEIRWTVE